MITEAELRRLTARTGIDLMVLDLAQADVSLDAVRDALPAKFAAKGIELLSKMAADLDAKRPLFAEDWDRRLAHLLPIGDPLTFDVAWAATRQLVNELGL